MKKEINWAILKQHFKKIPSNTTLIKQGNKPTYMYVLIQGVLNTYKNDQLIATISKQGEYIGELSILLGLEYTATVVTKTDSIVIEIEFDTIIPFLTKSPDIAISIAINLANRLAIQNTQLAQIVDKTRSNLEDRNIINDMTGIFDPIHFNHLFVEIEPGVEIIKENEKPKSMYILVNGEVDIIKEGKSLVVESASGIYFGDVSILRDSVANATVKTRKKSTMIEIVVDKVEAFLFSSPEVPISIARKLAYRLLTVNDEYLNIKFKK